jgi:hypothetical protein
VMTLLQALLNSKGTMAQFDHRELRETTIEDCRSAS